MSNKNIMVVVLRIEGDNRYVHPNAEIAAFDAERNERTTYADNYEDEIYKEIVMRAQGDPSRKDRRVYGTEIGYDPSYRRLINLSFAQSVVKGLSKIERKITAL